MAAPSRRKKAVALSYIAGSDSAPKLVAKGRGHTAEQIIALARKNYVPIRHDPQLVEVLAQLKVDQEIPPQLYKAVAAILAFLHRVNARQ